MLLALEYELFFHTVQTRLILQAGVEISAHTGNTLRCMNGLSQFQLWCRYRWEAEMVRDRCTSCTLSKGKIESLRSLEMDKFISVSRDEKQQCNSFCDRTVIYKGVIGLI